MTNRAGLFVTQPTGYTSFLPKPLPPNPPIDIDDEMVALLSVADRKLGRLDGLTQTLPNPELFVAMYVKKEALLSSQIEGTQASFVDILEGDSPNEEKRQNVVEVVHYVSAMDYGLSRLKEFPLSLRLLKEIHGKLLAQGRGSERNPGEFRTSQNWIGAPGSNLQTAAFVPPALSDMEQALGDLELYLHSQDLTPALIKIAMIHAQFESIHPFLDGNGRMGRLLITFWLCQQKILDKPLLYLSYYFKQNRSEYYDRLMDIRLKGAWEDWIKFFLKGIEIVSDEAILSAKQILELKSQIAWFLSSEYPSSNNHQRLLEELFENPIISKIQTKNFLEVSAPTANRLVDDFVQHGILKDISPSRSRGKNYAFQGYMEILERGT